MIKHIVCLKLKEFAEGASKQENARQIKEQIESLPAKISQIKSVEVGVNCVPAPVAYDLALYAEFANREDLDIYVKHPEHVKVGQFIVPRNEQVVVVDYEA